MPLTQYFRQTIPDRLNQHCILVWYDNEQAFGDFVASFKAPNCRVVLPETLHMVGRDGPLYEGEIERARTWAALILRRTV